MFECSRKVNAPALIRSGNDAVTGDALAQEQILIDFGTVGPDGGA
jgi:hypothetical protein